MDAIPLNRRTTSIERVIRSIVELMEPYAHDIRVTLETEIDPRLPMVRVDEDKIAWTIGTLIGNALRHVGRGTAFHPGGNVVVRAAVRQETGEVVIEVRDDGPGIPEDKLPLLFQPASDRRVGYALLLAREIVTAHGGAVEVDSTQDPLTHSTTMRLVLPAA
jgi:two-component system nitrogen regulation sensor histidine kinase GlnL